jgi:uncharacterized protein
MMTTKVRTKQDVLDAIVSCRATLISCGIARIGLFGSFVRDAAHEDSDVDVLVEFLPECKTLTTFMGAAFALEEAFGRKVDFVTTESLSPYFKPFILREVEYVTV